MGRYSTWRLIVGAAIFTLPAIVGLLVFLPRWEVLVFWGFAVLGTMEYGRMYYRRGVADAKLRVAVDTPKETT